MSEHLFFSVRAVVGAGWVRGIYSDTPIVTANAEEAWRWSDRDEALAVAAMLNGQERPVKMRVVPAPVGSRRIWGEPTEL